MMVRHLGQPDADDYIDLEIYPYQYGYGISNLIYGNQNELILTPEVVPDRPTIFSYRTFRNGVSSAGIRDTIIFTPDNKSLLISY